MKNIFKRVLAIVLSLCFTAEQAGFAQGVPQVALPAYIQQLLPQERFQPVRLRYLGMDERGAGFDLLLDKGDSIVDSAQLQATAAKLIEYFQIGLRLPNSVFWVNLCPDQPDRMIDPLLEKTAVGRVLLEADLQLKKDLSAMTDPSTAQGRSYWQKLYAKAEALYGRDEVEIPTYARPWIVPGEIILGESATGAYIYKASLQVQLESELLKTSDPRFKTLNDYASQLIRELIVPALTRKINSSKQYAVLRQVYYALILAQWYKTKTAIRSLGIDTNDLSGLQSQSAWDKDTYFKAYQRSFRQGEYSKEETVVSNNSMVIRQYRSGGANLDLGMIAKLVTKIKTHDFVQDDAGLLFPGSDSGKRLKAWINNGAIEIAADGQDEVAEENAVSLEEYIRYRKISLAEGKENTLDFKEFDDLPGLKEKIAQTDLGAAPLDALINRQAETIEQSVLELVSNASDAMTGRSAPIGRFGMGALQMLAFVQEGGRVTVDTATRPGAGRRIVFFQGKDQRIYFTTKSVNKDTQGTRVTIEVPKALNGIEVEAGKFLRERVCLFTKMPIFLNGKLVNTLDNFVYLNGDAVNYSLPEKRIDVAISEGRIVVDDTGSGMSDDVVFNKYLLPRLGENKPVPDEQAEEAIAKQVHIFYKAPEAADVRGECRIIFQVAGINIQTHVIEGFNLPKELIIELPSSTRLPVSRNEIEVDATTHTAIKLLADKIVSRDPIHQVALINGFTRAAVLLDEKNKRVGAFAPLLDTVKETFIPFVMKLDKLVLPNDEMFRQVAVPEGTLFLDQVLVYGLSPDHIPGSRGISKSFQPGTLKKAYTVPFKPDSHLTYLSFGPYLLLNQAIYEKYKDYPLFLNLRLNFYIGYGRRNPDKGWILPAGQQPQAQQENKATDADIEKLLDKTPVLNQALSKLQRNYLEEYLCRSPQQEKALAVFLQQIEQFMQAIPEVLRLQANWNELLPFKVGNRLTEAVVNNGSEHGHLNAFAHGPDMTMSMPGSPLTRKRFKIPVVSSPALLIPDTGDNKLDASLAIPSLMILPDKEFLAVHSAYFLNSEHPQRLQRYLENLLIGGSLKHLAKNGILHSFLSQADPAGLEYIDAEVLDYAAEVFANKNLENMEECFRGINQGLAHVKGEAAKRLMLRWMRLYRNDAKAAQTFYDLLSKEYARDIVREVANKQEAAPLEKTDWSTIKKVRELNKESVPYPLVQLVLLTRGAYKGYVLATNTDGNFLSIIDIQAGTVKKEIKNVGLNHPTGITQLANGDVAVIDEAGSLSIIDIQAGTVKKEIKNVGLNHPTGVTQLANGDVVITSLVDDSLAVIDIQSGITKNKIKGTWLNHPIGIIQLSNGDVVVFNLNKHSLGIIDIQTGTVKKEIKDVELSFPFGITLLPNDDVAVIDVTGSLSIIDIQTGTAKNKIEDSGLRGATGIICLNDSSLVIGKRHQAPVVIEFEQLPQASQETTGPQDGKSKWDYGVIDRIDKNENWLDYVWSVRPVMLEHGPYKGCLLTQGGYEGFLRVVDAASGRTVKKIECSEELGIVKDIVEMSDGKVAVVTHEIKPDTGTGRFSLGADIKVVDLETGNIEAKKTFGKPSVPPPKNSCLFAVPGGELVAVDNDARVLKSVGLYRNGLVTFRNFDDIGLEGPVADAVYLGDDKIAALEKSGRVVIFDINNPAPSRELEKFGTSVSEIVRIEDNVLALSRPDFDEVVIVDTRTNERMYTQYLGTKSAKIFSPGAGQLCMFNPDSNEMKTFKFKRLQDEKARPGIPELDIEKINKLPARQIVTDASLDNVRFSGLYRDGEPLFFTAFEQGVAFFTMNKDRLKPSDMEVVTTPDPWFNRTTQCVGDVGEGKSGFMTMKNDNLIFFTVRENDRILTVDHVFDLEPEFTLIYALESSGFTGYRINDKPVFFAQYHRRPDFMKDHERKYATHLFSVDFRSGEVESLNVELPDAPVETMEYLGQDSKGNPRFLSGEHLTSLKGSWNYRDFSLDPETRGLYSINGSFKAVEQNSFTGYSRSGALIFSSQQVSALFFRDSERLEKTLTVPLPFGYLTTNMNFITELNLVVNCRIDVRSSQTHINVHELTDAVSSVQPAEETSEGELDFKNWKIEELPEPHGEGNLTAGVFAGKSVARSGVTGLRIIDPVTREELKEIETTGEISEIVELAPDIVGVSDKYGGLLLIVDLVSGTVRKIGQNLLGKPGFFAKYDDDHVMVTNRYNDTVAIINFWTGEVKDIYDNHDLRGPEEIIKLSDGTCLVANRPGDNNPEGFLSVIDLKNRSQIKKIKGVKTHVVQGSGGMYEVSPGFVAVSAYDGFSIVDINKGKVIEFIDAFHLHGSCAPGAVFVQSGDEVNIMRFPEKKKTRQTAQPLERSGFAALAADDDLSGLPSLERNLVRFLKEKDIEFVEEGELEQRQADWIDEQAGLVSQGHPVSLALLNYVFEKYSARIKNNPDLTWKEFKDYFKDTQGIDLTSYRQIILSAIEGQDRTERVWIREIGLQNPRDAIHKQRQEGKLAGHEGRIEHRNFLHGAQWVYSIKDSVGMSLWQLVRYYFPLDESSKHFLEDTGNLGQGNYTLFSDFDEVFIRTSLGDGIINELVIRNGKNGPEIVSWDVLKGEYRGTEIRRMKDVEGSDPQLESLFIQEALQRFGGAISPDDVEITYNGKPFNEKIDTVAEVPLGGGWGTIGIGRAQEKFKKRVIQDELFVKAPDEKELKFVPQWIRDACERFGGMHIMIPRQILLNIPRNGYSQEQKFLYRLRLAVLHCMMQVVLKDYMDSSASIPAMPRDYLSNENTDDQADAQRIARLMQDNNYEEIAESELQPFLNDPVKFFELISHVPFTSDSHNGLTTLHQIRELALEKAMMRRARAEAASVHSSSLEELFSGKQPRGEFLEDVVEAMGGANALRGDVIDGLIGARARGKRGKVKDAKDVLNGLPGGAEELFTGLSYRILKTVGINDPTINYYYQEQPAVAKQSASCIHWNLYHMASWMEDIFKFYHTREELDADMRLGVDSRMWHFLETIVHESQHLPEFEAPGDHTHHADESIDKGFAARMGKAFDNVLYEIEPEKFLSRGEAFRDGGNAEARRGAEPIRDGGSAAPGATGGAGARLSAEAVMRYGLENSSLHGYVSIDMTNGDFADEVVDAILDGKAIVLYPETQETTGVSVAADAMKEKVDKLFDVLNNRFDSAIAFGIREMVKNAFVHGNAARTELPVFMFIELDQDARLQRGRVIDYSLGTRDRGDEQAKQDVLRKTMAHNASLNGSALGERYLHADWDYRWSQITVSGELFNLSEISPGVSRIVKKDPPAESPEALVVEEGSYRTGKGLLKTSNVGSSVALVAWDARTKQGALAHVIPGSSVKESLRNLFDQFAITPRETEIMLVGSFYFRETDLLKQIEDELWALFWGAVKVREDIDDAQDARSIVFNPQDGSYYDSAGSQRDGGKGGIDLRSLPSSASAIDTAALRKLAQNSKMTDLDKEWVAIEKAIQSKDVPYDRIQEYLAVCCHRQDRVHQAKAAGWLYSMLRAEEECALPTAVEMKQILQLIAS